MSLTLPTGVSRAILRETEKQFQAKVIQWARLNGWMHYHTHDARRSPEGFPDLVLVRPPEIIYAELKSERGRETLRQGVWLSTLRACNQEVYLWRPSDWPEIEERLRRRRSRFG